MSRHLGDFDASTVIYGKFTTFRPSTGAPYTLAGSPVLSVYKDNSTTQSTTGVTLTVDFDSVTGLHHFAIDTSADGTFYSAGSFFDVVITTGTVDSVSAVGMVVGSFTIRKNSALKPTTAGRTLDVSSGGEAGVDWANVGSPTTTVALSGTTVKTATDVETDTQDIQARLPAALTGAGNLKADVLAINGVATTSVATINANVGTTQPVNFTGTSGSALVKSDMVDIAGAAVSTSSAQIGVNVVNAGGTAWGSGAITSGVFATGAITATAIAADAIGASELAADAATEIADAVLSRNVSNVEGTAGEHTLCTLVLACLEYAISGTTWTIYRTDHSTTHATKTLTTDAAADPVTGVD